MPMPHYLGRNIVHQVEALEQKYAALRKEDRRALQLLALIVTVLFIWKLVWQPLESARIENAAAYQKTAATLVWMKDHANQAMAKAAEDKKMQSETKSHADGRPLLAIIGDSAATYNMTLSHAEPAENDSVHLSLDSASYSHLLPWLESLQREQGVTVSQVSIQKLASTPGYVSATLTLHQK